MSLVYLGNPFLRKKAKPVKHIDDDLRKMVSCMIEVMDAKKGVGIAANQIGKLLHIFIIRPVIKSEEKGVQLGEVEIYINPKLSKFSLEKEIAEEGCLSIPGVHAEVERSKRVHIEALDIDGKEISKDVEGFKARQIMHETDHLNGILFIDHLPKGTLKLLEPALQRVKKEYKTSKPKRDN